MKRYNFLRTKKNQFKPKNLFTISLGAAFLISQPVAKVSANPVTVTVSGTSYSLTTQVLRSYDLDLNLMQSQDWYGKTSLAESLAGQLSNQLSINEPSSSWLGAFLVTSNFLDVDFFMGTSDQTFLNLFLLDYISVYLSCYCMNLTYISYRLYRICH